MARQRVQRNVCRDDRRRGQSSIPTPPRLPATVRPLQPAQLPAARGDVQAAGPAEDGAPRSGRVSGRRARDGSPCRPHRLRDHFARLHPKRFPHRRCQLLQRHRRRYAFPNPAAVPAFPPAPASAAVKGSGAPVAAPAPRFAGAVPAPAAAAPFPDPAPPGPSARPRTAPPAAGPGPTRPAVPAVDPRRQSITPGPPAVAVPRHAIACLLTPLVSPLFPPPPPPSPPKSPAGTDDAPADSSALPAHCTAGSPSATSSTVAGDR